MKTRYSAMIQRDTGSTPEHHTRHSSCQAKIWLGVTTTNVKSNGDNGTRNWGPRISQREACFSSHHGLLRSVGEFLNTCRTLCNLFRHKHTQIVYAHKITTRPKYIKRKGSPDHFLAPQPARQTSNTETWPSHLTQLVTAWTPSLKPCPLRPNPPVSQSIIAIQTTLTSLEIPRRNRQNSLSSARKLAVSH
jgi:hypothetical protein